MKDRSLFLLLGILSVMSLPAFAMTTEQIAAYEQRINDQQRQLDEMRRALYAMKADASMKVKTRTD